MKLWRIGRSKGQAPQAATTHDKITSGLALRLRAANYSPDPHERRIRQRVISAAWEAWRQGQHPLEAAYGAAETPTLEADRLLARAEASAVDRMVTQILNHDSKTEGTNPHA